jgi:hypothetical protein
MRITQTLVPALILMTLVGCSAAPGEEAEATSQAMSAGSGNPATNPIPTVLQQCDLGSEPMRSTSEQDVSSNSQGIPQDDYGMLVFMDEFSYGQDDGYTHAVWLYSESWGDTYRWVPTGWYRASHNSVGEAMLRAVPPKCHPSQIFGNTSTTDSPPTPINCVCMVSWCNGCVPDSDPVFSTATAEYSAYCTPPINPPPTPDPPIHLPIHRIPVGGLPQ